MKILAIETSCDDTCVAIIKTPDKKGGKFKVLSNIVSSQIEIHKKYGGVYPTLAKREHQRNLLPVLIQALKESKLLKNQKSNSKNQKYISKIKNIKNILKRESELLKQLTVFFQKYDKPDINLIAVTAGPGLEPCLWVGVNFARTLSYFWDIPIVPVNHIEAHILVNFIDKDFQFSIFNFQKLFPAVALVVSGGHTQMILMKNFGNYKILGETRDDAAGECFDKTARILGLGYPGGPVIAKQAENYWDVIPPKALGGMTSLKLPRPMIHSKDYDFSFSGLKTAVLYEHKKQSAKIRKDKKYIQAMCKEIQQAVIDVLIKKTIKAAKDSNSKTIILGGGVAANEELRKQFVEKTRALNALSARPSTQIKNFSALVQKNYNLLVPKPTLCTDNAVMTAITAYFHKTQTRNWQKIKAEANLRID